MDPPFSARLIDRFVYRYCDAVNSGSQGFVLTNNCTETAWFRALWEVSTGVCFPKYRINFYKPDSHPKGSSMQGQAIFYAGDDYPRFKSAFQSEGLITRGGLE
ncbi:hypothetical protein [Ovoidimarina sediminis]|uniref:hypothetical protein n=1 Tax=Ovoidimarina sediminis TaxID=3079856 RepID=UPI00290756CE|nr:hypothetical protein [Rhodophyticola sp. MJ-SS7]MDU8946115.1 hypothetical protein [Rhodophyticola sp. MJ-SS7]